jgi:hypothetical protein
MISSCRKVVKTDLRMRNGIEREWMDLERIFGWHMIEHMIKHR